MKTNTTESEKERAVRTVYAAIDAVQSLCDRGFGCDATDRSFENLRELERRIDALPIRTRNRKS